MNYLLDTTVVIGMLKNNKKIINEVQRHILKGDIILIDAVSYYEAKRRLIHTPNRQQEIELTKLQNKYNIVLHDNLNIFDIAANNWAHLRNFIKARNLKSRDADNLIASNAIHRNYTVVSHDKHFQQLTSCGLMLERW